MLACAMSNDLLCSCHRLRRAGRAVTRLYERALDGSGVTISQFAVLAALGEGHARSVSELARLLGSDRTTMTRTLERLLAAGLLREDPGEDQREHRVMLTDTGRTAFAGAVACWRRAEGTLNRAMGPERLALLWQLLEEAETATRSFDPSRAARKAREEL
ncbi:MarR family winged helix-turn-helix transcriptional regulator [Stappia indica]|uniref:MarR family winged helix-turn-helix transcriptional regulator n=1 Tax=Stappia indica TaxID=538381 RepID=UPI001CD71B20|nr:MarR family transcriptional regulator [Stappia indica]MCA1297835.1 MarR family transcriptional regulator [Stappia indica]